MLIGADQHKNIQHHKSWATTTIKMIKKNVKTKLSAFCMSKKLKCFSSVVLKGCNIFRCHDQQFFFQDHLSAQII